MPAARRHRALRRYRQRSHARHWTISAGDWGAPCFWGAYLRDAGTGHRPCWIEDGEQRSRCSPGSGGNGDSKRNRHWSFVVSRRHESGQREAKTQAILCFKKTRPLKPPPVSCKLETDSIPWALAENLVNWFCKCCFKQTWAGNLQTRSGAPSGASTIPRKMTCVVLPRTCSARPPTAPRRSTV